MVDSLYSLVEVVLGTQFILLGLCSCANPKKVKEVLDFFMEESQASSAVLFVTLTLLLPMGLSIVWVHNEWIFDFPVIVTLFGWFCVLSCVLWLVLPEALRKLLHWMRPVVYNPWFVRAYGLFVVVLGLCVIKPYVYL